MTDIIDWIQTHEELLQGLALLSAVTFLFSLLVLPLIIIFMPANYFVASNELPPSRTRWRLTLRILKNLLGAIVLISGVLMLFLPGQGILGILVGCSLLDLPGKRRVQLALLKNKNVRQSVHWIRRKANQQPIQIPEV